MQQVVSAIAQYHPSFPDEIEGCTPEEMEHLHRVVDRPVPESYVDFARLMGHKTGEPSLFSDVDFTIATITNIHADKSELDPPQRYFLIGSSEVSPYEDFYLDCGVEGDPHVVRFSTPPKKELFPRYLQAMEWLACSLYELIFTRAYYRYHVRTFQNERHLDAPGKDSSSFGQDESLLIQLGFSRHSLSTERVACYERGDATVVAVKNPGAIPYIHVVAYNRKELLKLSDILSERLNLRPRRGE